MSVIYIPQGLAGEYAKRACNPYNCCTHGCLYCFGARWKKAAYFADACPKKDVIARVRAEAAKLRQAGDCPEILLSFQGDVYQHVETSLGLTRIIISTLRSHALPFTVLTKGGMRATRDFDLYTAYPARFGTSLVWTRQRDLERYEPYAASIVERVRAMEQAKDRGIPTWVSLEPVIDAQQAIEVVQSFHHVVDRWWVGKINHIPALSRPAAYWTRFTEEITEVFEKHHCTYTFKTSLTNLQKFQEKPV